MHTAVDVFTNRFASICLIHIKESSNFLKSSKVAKSRRMKKRIVGQSLNAQSMVLLSNHHPQKRTVIYSRYGQRPATETGNSMGEMANLEDTLIVLAQ